MMPWLEFIETCRALAWANDEESVVGPFEKLYEEKYWNSGTLVGDLRLALFDRAQELYVDRMLSRYGDGFEL